MVDKACSIFVLGARGFIGRALVETLVQSGHEVVTATRRPATLQHKRVTNKVSAFSHVDEFTHFLDGVDCVVHAASISTPGSNAARPQLDSNLRVTLGLIEALQKFPSIRLVYISSGGSLYDDGDKPILEDAPLRPRSYHVAGKIAAESFIKAWASQYSSTAIILRPSNVYGPGQKPGNGFGVVPNAFRCVLEDAPFMVLGDGCSLRDYLYIDDFVALCTAALSVDVGPGAHVYNAASGNTLELLALFDRIDATTDMPLRRVFRPARTIDVCKIMLDNSSARAVFGWNPAMDIGEGLRRSWSWFREST